jgi:hypothetical protein
MWYQENKYDMEHADEIIEDDDDYNPSEMEMYFEANVDDEVYGEFDNEEEARVLFEKMSPTAHALNLRHNHWNNTWTVEGMTTEYYQAAINRFNEWRQFRKMR